MHVLHEKHTALYSLIRQLAYRQGVLTHGTRVPMFFG